MKNKKQKLDEEIAKMDKSLNIHIFEYLKDNLQIQCDKESGDGYYSSDRIKIQLQLRNPETDELQTIYSDSCSIE